MNTPQKDPNYRLQPNYKHTGSQIIFADTFQEYIIIKNNSIEGRNLYNLDEFVVTTVQKVARKVKNKLAKYMNHNYSPKLQTLCLYSLVI